MVSLRDNPGWQELLLRLALRSDDIDYSGPHFLVLLVVMVPRSCPVRFQI